MRWTRTVRLRLRSLFWGRRVEHELTAELQYHLERLVDDVLGSFETAHSGSLAR